MPARTLAGARFSLARSRTKVVTVRFSRPSLRTLLTGGRRAVLVVGTRSGRTTSVARIRIRLALFPDTDRARVEAEATAIAAQALADLGIAGARIEVEFVERIDRVGGGAKEKIVY